MAALRRYLAEQEPRDYLFLGQDEEHLASRSVGYRLQYYAGAGRDRAPYQPATLRHSIAVHYLQGGAPVSFVQALLGHASLATTGIYLQLTDQMAQEIVRRTETALEAPAQAAGTVREAQGVYHAEPTEWDDYVADVLAWLAE